MLTVLRAGLQTLVVDAGRLGWAHLGVPRSGALDPAALAHANALVGNPPDAAGLECLLRGPVLQAPGRRLALDDGSVAEGHLDATKLPSLRAWIAVEGGIATPPVLGSRSADLLGHLGPPPLADGGVLPLGPPTGWVDFGQPADRNPPNLAGDIALLPGPDAVTVEPGPWTVQPHSDRTALRLGGPAKPHALPGITRGLVPGAVQVPPDGNPVVFLAGHPATGGYPVAGFVRSADLAALAQLRPGAELSFAAPRPKPRRRR